ncbi:HAMP domain-containing protein [Elusimicrobiota bacterium]
MKNKLNTREKIIIKKVIQLKYAVVVLLAMLITAVTVGADFYYSLHGFMKEYLEEIPAFDQLMNNLNQLMYAKIVVLFIIAVAISLLVSHKFMGPIFKLEESIKKVSEGDLTYKMRLRAGDELKSVSEIFNFMLDRFRKWVELDKRITREVSGRLGIIKNKIEDNEIKEEIEELRNDLEKVAENWKTEDKDQV